MVKVTFVIPTYNCLKYVKDAIDSCLAQTYKDFEILVIDDGSTDGTREMLIKLYEGKNLPIMIHAKNNGGTASAINTGIKWAKGEYIHWLSADDVLYPDALEKMLLIIDGHTDPKNCIFYSNYDYIDSQNHMLDRQFIELNYNEDPEKFKKDLWDHHIGNGSSSMIHRSIFDKIGIFDNDIKYCEDYEFWMRAALVFGIRFWLVPEITLHYRVHTEQTTKILGSDIAPYVKKCRKLVWDRLADAHKAAYPLIE